MQFEVVNVTPHLAKLWLALNSDNRPLRAAHVASLSAAMKRGEFMVTHQPIAINGTRLIDGQHRLQAFLKSGLTELKMSVVTGVDCETFKAIDVGAKRNMADIFKLRKDVSQCVRAVAFLLRGGDITPHQLEPYIAAFASDFQALCDVNGKKNVRLITSTPSQVAALAAIFVGTPKEYVYKIYGGLKDFDFENLPPVAVSLLRGIAEHQNKTSRWQGKTVTSTNRSDALARFFVVYQEANRDNKVVRVVKGGEKVVEQIKQIYQDEFAKRQGVKEWV